MHLSAGMQGRQFQKNLHLSSNFDAHKPKCSYSLSRKAKIPAEATHNLIPKNSQNSNVGPFAEGTQQRC